MASKWKVGNTHFEAEIGPLTRVRLYNEEYDVWSQGYARYNPADEFNALLGLELATARAQERLYKKIRKRLVYEANTY